MKTPLALDTLGWKELQHALESLGEPAYRSRQIFMWLYQKGVFSFEEMTDLPRSLRTRLAERAILHPIELVRTQQARDKTIKCLFKLTSGAYIESVLIPDFKENNEVHRLTVCVSSQVGCAMGCRFCATGMMGFHQNLTAGEIVQQVIQMNRLAHEHFGRRITNIVYMGMGEPLLNYDQVLKSVYILTHRQSLGLAPRRITISTVGLARRIKQLAEESVRPRLAVSLHAPVDEKRSAIMPVNRSRQTDLRALREALTYYYERTRQPVTYEYCLFQGFNDSPEDARQLARICRWVPSKVNLIMYNPVAGVPFKRVSEERLNDFIQELLTRHVRVTVRRSRGDDIQAACGQLATEEQAS